MQFQQQKRRNTPPRKTAESGSVFWIILIAIALFAALSYAMLQGGRLSQSTLSADQARLSADHILQYSNTLAAAVQKLKLRGYADEELSFANAINTHYANTNCTEDACKVFAAEGGSISYLAPESAWLSDTGDAMRGQWIFTGRTCVSGVGTGGAACASDTQAELIAVLPSVRKEVCQRINHALKLAGEYDEPPSDTGGFLDTAAPYWTEAGYSASASRLLGDAASAFNGASAGCVKSLGGSPAASSYNFYRVLIAR